jgi:uncharacterized OsmC-like protein
MSQTTLERAPLNGVDVPTLFATINHVAEMPELAEFRFRATNEWEAGTHSRTSIHSFYGAGSEQEHGRVFEIDADHPAVLTGGDNGAAPIEIVLAALASCLTSGIANIASARGVTLTSVRSSVEADMDLRGILGLSDEVRNGFSNVRVNFEIEGDAPAAKLAEIVEQSRRRSAVYDIVTNGVPVEITVDAV